MLLVSNICTKPYRYKFQLFQMEIAINGRTSVVLTLGPSMLNISKFN